MENSKVYQMDISMKNTAFFFEHYKSTEVHPGMLNTPLLKFLWKTIRRSSHETGRMDQKELHEE
jgi:hypothetical protein